MESKGTPIDTLRDKWDDFSDVYCRFDPGPQTFYFSLVNLLKFRECKNILEIACGSGRLLPYIVSQKPKDTQYVATDLSPEMIKKAEKNMRDSLELFGSKHSYEDFMKENRMFLKACDGQQPVEGFGKFDAVICNLVLMLTDDPKKMLRSLHSQCVEGARLGLTIWGDKTKNNFTPMFGKAVMALGLPPPKDRSPFYLRELIDEMVVECGWETELKWDQIAPFPFLTKDDINYFVDYQVASATSYSPEDAKRIGQKLHELFTAELNKKQPIVMHNTMMIIRRK